MSRYDAIVIGAGINGLIAAGILAKNGLSVCLVEAAETVGGMATMRVEEGPELAHLLYSLSPRVLADLGLETRDLGTGQEASSVALDPGGRHVVMRGDRLTWMDGTPHPDAETWAALHARVVHYAGLLRHLAEGPPPGGGQPIWTRSGFAKLLRLGRFGLGLKRMARPEMRRFLQVLLTNAYDFILDDLPDGPLAGMLAADATRGNAMGPRSPGTVLTWMYRVGHGGTVTAPTGGMSAIMERLKQAVETAGSTIRTGSRVARVLVSGDAVAGVELDMGKTIHAPRVLSSLGPQALLSLTGMEAFDIEATRRIRNIRARGTVAKVNLHLARPGLPDLPSTMQNVRLVFAPSADYVETAFNPSKYGEMTNAPVIEALPVSKGSDHWLSCNAQYVPVDLKGGWTDDAKDKLAQTTRDTLARALPKLTDYVQSTQVITPDQIAEQTGAPGGHWHHGDMTLDQLLSLRPANGLSRYAFGPKGLYLCGASAHPGGDVMGLAGRNAALAALEDQP